MKLETKYNIGDRVWIVYESRINNQFHHDEPAGEISVYEDSIVAIEVDKDGTHYLLKYSDCMDLEEKDIILYDETDKLINTIKELMNEINEREGKEE